jgi:hypothetical protein
MARATSTFGVIHVLPIGSFAHHAEVPRTTPPYGQRVRRVRGDSANKKPAYH